MRNTPLGEFRLTSALSARAAEIASEIGGVCHTRCPHARARGTARIGVSRPTRPSRRSAAATSGSRRLPTSRFLFFCTNLGSGLTMALGRSLDAAEQGDDEATAARPLVTVPIERRELGGRRAQHPAWRIPPH